MRIFKSRLQLLLVCTLAGFLLVTSCTVDKELGKPSFSPDFILPLVNGELTLKNLSKDTSTIQTDPTGYFKVGFKDTVFQQDLGSQLAVVQDIPDVPQPMAFNIAGVNHLLTSKEYNYDISLALQLSKLTELKVNSGNLTLKIANNKTFVFSSLQFEIPGLLINGVAYQSATFDVSPGNVNTIVVPLTNAVWDLRGKNLDSNSLVYIKLNVGSGLNSGAQTGQGLISIALDGLDVEYSRGRYFTIELPPFSSGSDIIPATFYKNIKSGSLNLVGAQVKLNFDNTAGIPFAIDVKVETTNGVDGSVDSLKTGLIDIKKAIFAGPVTDLNEFVLGDAQGLGATISNFPTKLNVTAKVGFNQDPTSLEYFIYKTSALKLFVDAEIPFAIAFDQLLIKDTLKFSLFETLGESIDTAVTKLDTGGFTFKIANGFPYDISLNLLAMNGAYDSIATIVDFSLLGASTTFVGGEERVTIPRYSTFSVNLTQSLFERLKVAKYLSITAKLNTPTGVVSPKIYTDYKLGFDAKARIKITARPF